jgi:CRISPR-associated endonuclease/helicase Cas3
VLIWRGAESRLARNAGEIGPGDTVILDASDGGFQESGHVPEGCEPDAAERARLGLPRRMCVRLHAGVLAQWPQTEALPALAEAARSAEATPQELLESFRAYQESLPDGHWLKGIVFRNARSEPYPEAGGEHVGWLLAERMAEADSGEDESSSGEPVPLAAHLEHVTESVRDLAAVLLEDDGLRERVVRAAAKHDIGKSDLRFQALLWGGDLLAAQFAPVMLAKGRRAKASGKARQAQYERSGLPDGFRHELKSLSQLRGAEQDDLVLHLVASHHGRCRPFAPFVDDPEEMHAAHRLDSGVADRFWRLTRQYGWWGLAYLEAMLRLGDWNASAEEAQ